MRRLIVGLLLVVPAFLLPAIPASASDASQASVLILHVHGEHGGPWDSAVLHCRPDGGTHQHAVEACAALYIAGGDLDNLPGDPGLQLCTLEYRPVTATAHGMWHGSPVHWRHTFANDCTLRAATGPVFDF